MRRMRRLTRSAGCAQHPSGRRPAPPQGAGAKRLVNCLDGPACYTEKEVEEVGAGPENILKTSWRHILRHFVGVGNDPVHVHEHPAHASRVCDIRLFLVRQSFEKRFDDGIPLRGRQCGHAGREPQIRTTSSDCPDALAYSAFPGNRRESCQIRHSPSAQ